jgi:hypothetical protein
MPSASISLRLLDAFGSRLVLFVTLAQFLGFNIYDRQRTFSFILFASAQHGKEDVELQELFAAFVHDCVVAFGG